MEDNKISKSFKLLYLTYVISCIGDRLWTFAIVFVMQQLGGMRLVGINQLFESLSLMFSASYVGNWLDKNSRKYGVLTIISINNISILISATLLIFCLSLTTLKTSILYTIFLTFSIFFCALSSVATEGQRLAFTKDWIVVMSQAEDGNTLSNRNAMMTTIDQLSTVIAPIFTGIILQYFTYPIACMIFISWNLLSWIIERWLICKVYNQVKDLSIRHHNNINDDKEIDPLLLDDKKCYTNLYLSIKAYLKQQVFPAAFALALLYMTVLGFDGLAVSHGQAQGLSEDMIGIFRSISSALGIVGCFVYTFTEQRIGVRKTGLIGLTFQLTFLSMCVLSIFLPGSPFDPIGYISEFSLEKWLSKFKSSIYLTELPSNAVNLTLIENNDEFNWSNLHLINDKMSILIFFIGLTISRLGLWMADLSITQIMQESIQEEERNTIFGVQNAFCQFFSVLKDVLVILLPDQRTFGILIIMSFMFVTLGLLKYCWYLFKTKSTKNRRLSKIILPKNINEDEKIIDNNQQ